MCCIFKKITWQDLSISTNIILSSLTWCLTPVSTFPLLIAETGQRCTEWSRCFFMTQWLKGPISCQLRTDIIQRPRPSGWKAPFCEAWDLDEGNFVNLKIINLNIIWLNFRSPSCKHSQGFNRIDFVFFISWWYQVLKVQWCHSLWLLWKWRPWTSSL